MCTIFCIGFLAVMVDYFSKGSNGEGAIALALAVACGYGAYAYLFKKAQEKEQLPQEQPTSSQGYSFPHVSIQRESGYSPDIPQQPKEFPVKRGYYVKYHYDDVEAAVRDRYADHALQPGDALKFIPEPNNQYDAGAVAIYHGADKVGYMYRGRLQDMCRDFTERGDKVAGIVVSDDFGKMIYKIAFYAPQIEE